ncbi:CubicO group peptidase (beta-lactamase class C family) [Kribbella aluminosa]|uniref:CubicO group peptidase (Beta-lactamase class C family) n=1 Tax=Kribbella aluminosa TaxID=416017 RepID=A0ABS4UK13_9ACTN|nr:serine hydrolase [Kribbella aluminosa]MBP2351992.1 CubicO group peptidase (beta-lactamase class C family) [Kribbella aluminosa]
MSELVPTAPVDRGPDAPWFLDGWSAQDGPGPALGAANVSPAGGQRVALDDLLTDSQTDAFVVLHRGRALHEEYRHGMGQRVPHLAMSVSKSVSASAVGAVVDAGELHLDAEVAELIGEFRGTGMEGATVRDVLDMRTGTREEITTLEQQRAYYANVQWAPASERVADENSRTHFWRMRRTRPHGGDFEYRSTLTCVLAMLAERATGRSFPDVLSTYLWSRLGAEYPAAITVDRDGNALADIGFCCTVRDLARLGEVLRRDGIRPDGERLLSAEWVADTLTAAPGQLSAFRERGTAYLPMATAYYRNQWWVARGRTPGRRDGIYFALGIHGQLLMIHEAAEVVIAKFSSWRQTWEDDLAQATIRGCIELAEQLAQN